MEASLSMYTSCTLHPSHYSTVHARVRKEALWPVLAAMLGCLPESECEEKALRAAHGATPESFPVLP